MCFVNMAKLKPRAPRDKHFWEPYLLLAPGLIITAVIMGYPLLYSIRLSFMNYNLMRPDDIYFAGFANYTRMFQDPEILKVTINSVVWVVWVVGLQFVFGMALALLLNSKFRGKGIYQSVVFLPWAVSGFLIGLTFKFIFNERNGVLNFFLEKLGLIDGPMSWLGNDKLSMIGPMAGMVWYGIPFFGIMILAALQSIPVDVIESGRIDGAGTVKIFLMIMLPYIKPTILTTLLLRVIWVFNSPDIIYVMTSGGPAYSSSTLPLYVFNQAFASLDFGYGSAVGILIMIFLTLYSLFYLKLTHYSKAGDF